MLGSTTAPGRPGARDDAPGHVAFRSKHSVGDPGVVFSRLNTQPMRTPVNASPSPSRGPTHDSGTVWFARPSLEETCTLYPLPVSRRAHCQLSELFRTPCGERDASKGDNAPEGTGRSLPNRRTIAHSRAAR